MRFGFNRVNLTNLDAVSDQIQADLDAANAAIAAEAALAREKETAEKDRAEQKETQLDDKIDQEITDRTSGDAATLAAAETYTNTKISALVDGADTALDTLKEIGDQLKTDESMEAALVNTIANDKVEVKAYTDTAKAALQAEIDALSLGSTTDLTQVRADFATADAATLTSAKAYTDTKVESEATIARAAESANATAITAEATTARTNETTLQSHIDALTSSLASESSSSTASLAAEAAARVASDSAQASALADEANTARAAESANATAIVNEATSRATEDAHLQSQIDALTLDGSDTDSHLQDQITAINAANPKPVSFTLDVNQEHEIDATYIVAMFETESGVVNVASFGGYDQYATNFSAKVTGVNKITIRKNYDGNNTVTAYAVVLPV